jgi:hypothetical protein
MGDLRAKAAVVRAEAAKTFAVGYIADDQGVTVTAHPPGALNADEPRRWRHRRRWHQRRRSTDGSEPELRSETRTPTGEEGELLMELKGARRDDASVTAEGTSPAPNHLATIGYIIHLLVMWPVGRQCHLWPSRNVQSERKLVTVAFYVFTALLVVLTAGPAALKFTGAQSMREGAEHFGIPWPRYRLIGVLEVAAAIGAVAGIIWRPIGMAAGAGVVALMLGALYYHIRAGDKASATVGAVVVLLCSVGYVYVGVLSA